jgi:metal-responsive CopG/Arc/MetJ family transcriptional regulator
MKIAISVPDSTFAAAERLAQRRRISRSRLYAEALEAYLRQHEDVAVTERLNAVHAATPERLDPTLNAAQLMTLADEAW